jgi:hypothetical protein
LYGDLTAPSFRGSQQSAAPSAGTAPGSKREAKPPKPKKEKEVELSLDISDPQVFRHRWDKEITKDCSAADAIDMKMSAEDRGELGINVGSLVKYKAVGFDSCHDVLGGL